MDLERNSYQQPSSSRYPFQRPWWPILAKSEDPRGAERARRYRPSGRLVASWHEGQRLHGGYFADCRASYRNGRNAHARGCTHRYRAEYERHHKRGADRMPGVTHAITTAAVRVRANTVTIDALITAVALASVSAFSGIVGMTAIYAAAAIPIMVMVGVLEEAKLVTCAWLARHWRITVTGARVRSRSWCSR